MREKLLGDLSIREKLLGDRSILAKEDCRLSSWAWAAATDTGNATSGWSEASQRHMIAAKHRVKTRGNPVEEGNKLKALPREGRGG